ncbi:hypothetical protein Tco_0352198 [Tanacetum coccineum]
MASRFLQRGGTLHLLEYARETEGTIDRFSDPDDIRRLLELERVMVDVPLKSPIVSPHSIKFHQRISPDMTQWEKLIRENVLRTRRTSGYSSRCLAHMCIELLRRTNTSCLFLHQKIQYARASQRNLPYGMFLTRLYRHVMEMYPHLDNGIYDIVDRVMRPLALKQTRRTSSDRAWHVIPHLPSSSHHHGTSSHT